MYNVSVQKENKICFTFLSVLECVNGDYGEYTKELNEEALKPEWNHEYQQLTDSASSLNNVQVVKMSEPYAQFDCKKRLSLSQAFNKHIYPPPEWMRLWLLIGRCHVQIFRDWVCSNAYV